MSHIWSELVWMGFRSIGLHHLKYLMIIFKIFNGIYHSHLKFVKHLLILVIFFYHHDWCVTQCRYPLDEFNLSVFDYDYVTNNSRILSMLSLPAWRIPHSGNPVEGNLLLLYYIYTYSDYLYQHTFLGWLPMWLGSSKETTSASGILWIYLKLEMKLQRIDSVNNVFVIRFLVSDDFIDALGIDGAVTSTTQASWKFQPRNIR